MTRTPRLPGARSEALICSADPLRCVLVFGLGTRTAMIYADLARRGVGAAEPTASTHPESAAWPQARG